MITLNLCAPDHLRLFRLVLKRANRSQHLILCARTFRIIQANTFNFRCERLNYSDIPGGINIEYC